MAYVSGGIAASLYLAAALLAAGSATHAGEDCLGGAQLLSFARPEFSSPCSSFEALYIYNNIEATELEGHPAPEGLEQIGMAVQSFAFRRDNLAPEGMVDHLIAALPLMRLLDEERFAIYSSYILFNYGKHVADGQDSTGALNPAIGMAGQQTRFTKPDEVVCFVELDVPSLPLDEVIASERYRKTCGATS